MKLTGLRRERSKLLNEIEKKRLYVTPEKQKEKILMVNCVIWNSPSFHNDQMCLDLVGSLQSGNLLFLKCSRSYAVLVEKACVLDFKDEKKSVLKLKDIKIE